MNKEQEPKIKEKPKDYSRRVTFSPGEKRAPEFESRLLDLARVERMTGGGRRFRFRAIVVIGNRKGKVGLGIAKGLDVAQSIEKATRLAQKRLIEVPIVEGTIPFESEAKFGAARVLIRPQRRGRGLVAGGVVRIVCSLAGIEDISSKIISKSRNKLNNARAVMKALKELKVQAPKVKAVTARTRPQKGQTA